MANNLPAFFPVLSGHSSCPKSFPWEWILPYEKRAIYNHNQTLKRLAERGGLCPGEIRCVVEDRDLFGRPWTPARKIEDAAWLVAWINEQKKIKVKDLA